jgi:hypothetical protein
LLIFIPTGELEFDVDSVEGSAQKHYNGLGKKRKEATWHQSTHQFPTRKAALCSRNVIRRLSSTPAAPISLSVPF